MNGPSEIGDDNSGAPSAGSSPGQTETPVIDRIPRLAAGKKSRKRRPPRPTRETPRTQLLLPRTGRGWFRLIAASAGALVVVGAALVGVRVISESDCQEFTTDRTSIGQDGLSIGVQPADLAGSFGVRLSSVQLADFRPDAADALAQSAASALPANLTPQSNLQVIQACSVNPRRATLRMAVPPEVSSTDGVDLYGWDAQARAWSWQGGHFDPASREVVAVVERVPAALMLAKSAPIAPTLGIEVPPVTGDPSAVLQRIPPSAAELDATGLYLGDMGAIVGDASRLLGASVTNGAAAVRPVIRNWGAHGEVNRTILRDMLATPEARQAHIANLAQFVEAANFAGLEVDYRGVGAEQREAFADFIAELGAKLAERDRTLTVSVPAPARPDADPAGAFDAPGYNLWRIGQAASRVKLDLSTNPAAIRGPDLDPMLDWATGLVDRHKLQVVVPTLGLQLDANGRVALIGLEGALERLGPLQADPPLARPGSTVRLAWSPGVSAASTTDPGASSYAYTYVDDRGIQQTVWLGTAADLKRALERLRAHNIRGVTLRGALQPGNDEGIAQVIDAFVRGDLASAPAPEPQVKVAFGQGTPFTLQLGQAPMEVQAPGGEGTYDLRATFQSARPVEIGQSQVQVSKDAPLPAGGATSATASALVTGTAAAEAVAPPPALPGVNADVFELGGHVNDLVHVTQMKGAGMSWARVESLGTEVPTAFIQEAKARGLNVLVTAVGDRNRIMDPGYRAEWVAHLGRLAAAGADAIEVWSEPNYEATWPSGQINGASYAELLQQAHAAIKQANPATLVVSAGLAQTAGQYSGGCEERGCDEVAFLGQMAAANAKDYMDCVGVHYTSGYTAPSTVGADHYSWYFEPLRNAYYGAFNGAKPVCFTALGYVSAEGFPGGIPANYSFAAGTTLDNHAAWLAEAAKMAKDSGKVRLIIVWNVDSTVWRGGEEGDPQAGYAIIRPDGTCPACESLRNVMGAQ